MAVTNIEYASNYFEIQEIGPFIKNSIIIALSLSALMALAFLLWGGINWITSSGDKAKNEEARNRITAAIIGLTIVACVWLIWRLILYLLGVGEESDTGITFPLPS